MRSELDEKGRIDDGRALKLKRPNSIAARFFDERPTSWQQATVLWRSVPAHAFHRDHRHAVNECMRRTSSTMAIWRAAIAGDAACAIKLALTMGVPGRITVRTDLTMTVLLHNVLRGDTAATLVLSSLIKRMPIDRIDRLCIAASWLAHNFRQAWPELDESVERVRRVEGEL